jgi:hypothetical protein
MMRSGSTPAGGEYSKNVTNALKYVCAEIEEADKESLFITNTRNTRIQGKLGQYIDTFLASQFLAEVKGSCGTPALETRVKKAFHKVMDKIERHQSKEGTWEKNGWAPVISQSVAAKAINRGAQKGLSVPQSTIARVENGARAALDTSKMVASAPTGLAGGMGGRGDVSGIVSGKSRTSSSMAAGSAGFGGMGGGMGGGSAGVPLYYYSANLGALQESVNTAQQREGGLQKQAVSGKTEKDRSQARNSLKEMRAVRGDLAKAQNEIVRKLEDKQFLAGFGSNGGEEFISYMNLGESLVTRQDEEWRKWDKWVTQNLNRIQNQDGSWTGHHCITGRVSCTAAALLTLMVDRSQPGLAKVVVRR